MSVPLHSVPLHSVPIHIFIMCHNESLLLPHTIAHYRKYLPSASIIVYDNESTDNSVGLATHLGCDVVSFTSNNILNEYILQANRNECWLSLTTGWVIIADMDEWLCVTEAELHAEYDAGTTLLTVKGYNMIGESQLEDLSDIDLHAIRKAVYSSQESKQMCLLRDEIHKMNYLRGSHSCSPEGRVQYSTKTYVNKHIAILGIPYLIKKMLERYERTHVMRQLGISGHYINDIERITRIYTDALAEAEVLEL